MGAQRRVGSQIQNQIKTVGQVSSEERVLCPILGMWFIVGYIGRPTMATVGTFLDVGFGI